MVKLQLFDDSNKITAWWKKFCDTLPFDIASSSNTEYVVNGINEILIPYGGAITLNERRIGWYIDFQHESDVAQFLLK